MKAVEYDRYGSAEVLQLRDVPRPRIRRGELLVRVRAAALNPKDVLVRSGKFALDRIAEAEAAAGTKHTCGKIVVRIG